MRVSREKVGHKIVHSTTVAKKKKSCQKKRSEEVKNRAEIEARRVKRTNGELGKA